MNRASFLAITVAMTACEAETYNVAVADPEVADATLGVELARLDEQSFAITLQLADPDGTDMRCPALSGEAEVVILADSETLSARVTNRGGAHLGIDCALKCRDLVAFGAQCAPVVAELTGPDVEVLAGASDVRIEVRDSEVAIEQALPGEALARREPIFPSGTEISDRLPIEWSHEGDVERWASQWPSRFKVSEGGQYSEFRLVTGNLETGPELVASPSNVELGERRVYFGSSAVVQPCIFGLCVVRHVVQTSVVRLPR